MARRAPVSVPDDQIRPWTPQAGPQEKAVRASFVTELFFGGARGGGKSDFLLGDFAADVNRYGHHWRGVLFRRTYPELDEIIARSKEIYYHAFPGAEYKTGAKTWIFPSGAMLRLRHIETESDADHYQGHAYGWIGLDELPTWENLRAYHKLKACLRVGGIEVKEKRIRATGNPGGAGHTAVKVYFIDCAPEGTVYLDPETGDSRMYIRSLVTDNKILLHNDPTYLQRLKGVGDPELVRAWLEGDWQAFVGAYFGSWRERDVRVPSFDIPSHWPLYGGMDYGEAKPTSFGLYTVDYDGIAYRIAEYYAAGRSASQHAEHIKKLVDNCPMTSGRLPQTIYCDPSMFVKRRLSETVNTSPADIFADYGLWLTPANNDRVTGWRVINDALIKGRLKAFDGWNDTLFAIMPTLPRDPKHPEDLDTRAEDHVADELRYALMHLYRPHMKARSQGRDPFLGSNLLDSLTVARAGRRPAGRVA